MWLLLNGRDGKQAPTPHALQGRIAEEANAVNNTTDRLTSARLRGL